MSNIITLSSLYLVCKEIALGQQVEIMVKPEDMLNYHHFELLCEAIEKYIKSHTVKHRRAEVLR